MINNMDKTLIIWALETLREQALDAEEIQLVARITKEINKVKVNYDEEQRNKRVELSVRKPR